MMSHVARFSKKSLTSSRFKAKSSKARMKFTQCNRVDFFLSIRYVLLCKSLSLARTCTEIRDDDINIILHARRALLFNKDLTQAKHTKFPLMLQCKCLAVLMYMTL